MKNFPKIMWPEHLGGHMFTSSCICTLVTSGIGVAEPLVLSWGNVF